MKIKKYNEFLDTDMYVEVDVKNLMDILLKECGNKSDLDAIAEHSSYKEIVKNGYDSIPTIIENIDNCHVVWFRALNEIIGGDIYNIYRTSDMRKYWKKWAIENGY